MTKFFLDSTVIISALTARDPDSVLILIEQKHTLFTNEYVIKETRRILDSEFGFNQDEINRSIDFIRDNCIVLQMPRKKDFIRIKIEDKSDRPIVYSAMKNQCILVTEDRQLIQNAKKYVKTLTPREL
jgi:predicted nucleic acid-binding protein